MTLRVTFDIFSGRPNPVVDLDAADSARLLARLQPIAGLRGANAVPPRASILGYRGLIVEQVGRTSSKLPQRSRVVNDRLFAPKTAWRLRSADVEDFILGLATVTRSKAFPKDLIALLRKEAASSDKKKRIGLHLFVLVRSTREEMRMRAAVRAGLVERFHEWRYQGIPEQLLQLRVQLSD
jgi:hypothetical protein